MKEIILYGELAERFGKRHRFAVKTAAEAIRALKANFKGFEKYMCEAHTHGVGFRMFVGGSKVNDYPEIHHPAGKANVIRLVPVITGSKDGFFQVLLGAALITAALIAAPYTAGASLTLVQAVGSLGVAMVIGGVSTLLASPPPGLDTSTEDRKKSHIFSGPINTSLQGKAVPAGYGRLIVGSAVVSAGIEPYDTTG